MKSTSKINETNFAEDIKENINFLKNYGESKGCDVWTLTEIIPTLTYRIISELECLKIDSDNKVYQFIFQIDTLVGLLQKDINSELFFHLSNLIYSLENNDYLKK